MSQGGVFLGNHQISKREATVDGRLVERARRGERALGEDVCGGAKKYRANSDM